MHKILLSIIMLGASVCPVFANAGNLKTINDYIQHTFPASFKISDLQISQLAWTLQHKTYTYDADLLVTNQQLHVEIPRTLTRLYCASLLQNGSKKAYAQFVAAQMRAGVKQPLSFATFVKLSKHVQKLTRADYLILENCAILSAISLTKPAADTAKRMIDIERISNDNLEFLSATLRIPSNIYPIMAQVQHDPITARKLLCIIFPPQTNFRHMLYTEGGIGMFKYLRRMIQHGYIDQAGLDLWYAHWIVSLAGFRGHIDQHGSLYLTEPVAQAMFELKKHIDEMLSAPNYDPLTPYLEYRASLLGLTHLPVAQRLTVAHLGALLRLYTVADGQQLHASFLRLPLKEQRMFSAHFARGLVDSTQITPTYAPALFGNGMILSKGDLDLVVQSLLPIYNRVLQQAVQQQIKAAVSFNDLSAQHNLRKLLAKDHSAKPEFKILRNGNVLLRDSS
jgi:hypothetical protein